MTNREAVIAEIQVQVGLSETSIDKALIDLAIDGTATYDGTNSTDVAKAAIKVLKSLLSTKSITEGGFSITLSVKERIADLQAEFGLTDVDKPSVRARYVW